MTPRFQDLLLDHEVVSERPANRRANLLLGIYLGFECPAIPNCLNQLHSLSDASRILNRILV